jgi:hypothetical protein
LSAAGGDIVTGRARAQRGRGRYWRANSSENSP